MAQTFGTEEYYQELFSDIIADVATGTDQDELTARNIMAGFEKAILSWMAYHEDATAKYRELHRRFLMCDTDPVHKAYE